MMPRIAVAGSGSPYLLRDKGRWERRLVGLIGAYDRKKRSASAVAEFLARLNFRVHAQEKTVGPGCIILWRNRAGGVHDDGDGGGHCMYINRERHPAPKLPHISRGADLRAFFEVILPHHVKQLRALKAGQPAELDINQLNAELAALLEHPDEELP